MKKNKIAILLACISIPFYALMLGLQFITPNNKAVEVIIAICYVTALALIIIAAILTKKQDDKELTLNEEHVKVLSTLKTVFLSFAIIASIVLVFVLVITAEAIEGQQVVNFGVSEIYFTLSFILIMLYASIVVNISNHLKTLDSLRLKALYNKRCKEIEEKVGFDATIQLPFTHNQIPGAIHLNRNSEQFIIGKGEKYFVFEMAQVSQLKITHHKIEFWFNQELNPYKITNEDDDEDAVISTRIKDMLENVFNPFIYASQTTKIKALKQKSNSTKKSTKLTDKTKPK